VSFVCEEMVESSLIGIYIGLWASIYLLYSKYVYPWFFRLMPGFLFDLLRAAHCSLWEL
jgi:hypothetical protein